MAAIINVCDKDRLCDVMAEAGGRRVAVLVAEGGIEAVAKIGRARSGRASVERLFPELSPSRSLARSSRALSSTTEALSCTLPNLGHTSSSRSRIDLVRVPRIRHCTPLVLNCRRMCSCPSCLCTQKLLSSSAMAPLQRVIKWCTDAVSTRFPPHSSQLGIWAPTFLLPLFRCFHSGAHPKPCHQRENR